MTVLTNNRLKNHTIIVWRDMELHLSVRKSSVYLAVMHNAVMCNKE